MRNIIFKSTSTEAVIFKALNNIRVKMLLLADLSGATNTVTFNIKMGTSTIASFSITLNAYEKYTYVNDIPLFTVPAGASLSVVSTGDATILLTVVEEVY